ncbi:hypothetical protein DL771_003860 [Monosporascus sp. 5C6A]|nr:hypothetical protein DL771_003860 [Monosporascus sp. 5C6A]
MFAQRCLRTHALTARSYHLRCSVVKQGFHRVATGQKPISIPLLFVAGKRAYSSGTAPKFAAAVNPSVQLDAAIYFDVSVKCVARARIPTFYGPAFLHLYYNNRDQKEHLAIVINHAQFASEPMFVPAICSASLDLTWDEETAMDRLIRGAYTGRLTEDVRVPSAPPLEVDSITTATATSLLTLSYIPAPLVRIYSECYTGETIGSMRCNCGEQLDEAIRQIALPITIFSDSLSQTTTIPGRGAVIYLRQEGRGIGLAAKLRAYNLQDMGHDTLSANLMFGHGADERSYDVAAAILRDLGLIKSTAKRTSASLSPRPATGIRLLTNNPAKVQAMQAAGINVLDRVEMVPRSWQCDLGYNHVHNDTYSHSKPVGLRNNDAASAAAAVGGGVTMISAGAAQGADLDKYLKAKVEKMGHMLSLLTGRKAVEIPSI